MNLYNLFPLLAGPLTGWRGHFSRAVGMEFNWVFINPIQLPGASGSLYSIADYFKINPVLLDSHTSASADEQVRKMIADARASGLSVMIDLVINHCAMDAPLTREHPEWFVREAGGRIANACCQNNGEKVVWKDLAQFDHEHTRDREGLYRYALGVVEHLVGLGFEGFRCDAAYQVPRPFWQRLIGDIKKRRPNICFAAETLGCSPDQTLETARAGFDYVFNSSKWWNLQDWWLIEQYSLLRETTRSISFAESHDTVRLWTELEGNLAAIKQRYLVSALFAAGVMMPIGFEYGFRRPLHVVRTTPGDWEQTGVDFSPFIAKTNAIRNTHAVFQGENPTTILPSGNPNVLLMWKASLKDKDEALLILNRDPHQHQEFQTDHFRRFVQSQAPLRDVSPEHPMDYLSEPFHYSLRPGQGIVLVTRRA
jgi:starch synthase (maltosyl-transferring)